MQLCPESKGRQVIDVLVNLNRPRSRSTFALVAKLPELLDRVPYDDHLAYLCHITREGDLVAARAAKERGVLTRANVGGVIVRLVGNLTDNRGGYEDLLLVDGIIAGPEYHDLRPEEQRRFDALAAWLIRSFEFTPEAARKIVDANNAEAPPPLPLPLLAAQAWLPLDGEGCVALLSDAIASLGKRGFCKVHFDADSVRAVAAWPLFRAYAHRLLDGAERARPRRRCFREVMWGVDPAPGFQNITFDDRGDHQGFIVAENTKCGIGGCAAHSAAFRAFAGGNERALRLLGAIAGNCAERAGRPALVKFLRGRLCYAGESDAVLALAEAFLEVRRSP
jgi:hypothetical protein